MISLTIAPGIINQLEAAALERLPEEACALLLGRKNREGVCVDAAVMSVNVASGDKRTAFEIDPALYIRLHKAAREGGLAVVGVWHSHPNGRAVPSATDEGRSVEADWLWLITAVTGRECETLAYKAGDQDPHRFDAVDTPAVG